MNFLNMFIMMTIVDLAMDLGTEMTLAGIRGLLDEKFPTNNISDGFIGKFLEQMPQRVSMFATMAVMQHSNLIMNSYVEPFVTDMIDKGKDLKAWFKTGKGIVNSFASPGGSKFNVKGVASSALKVLDTYQVTQYNQYTDEFMLHLDFLYKKQDLSNGVASATLNGINTGIIASNTKSLSKKTMTSDEMIKLLNGLLNSKKYGG